jgi:RimJ/RimL family protein N-acetyltransferase
MSLLRFGSVRIPLFDFFLFTEIMSGVSSIFPVERRLVSEWGRIVLLPMTESKEPETTTFIYNLLLNENVHRYYQNEGAWTKDYTKGRVLDWIERWEKEHISAWVIARSDDENEKIGFISIKADIEDGKMSAAIAIDECYQGKRVASEAFCSALKYICKVTQDVSLSHTIHYHNLCTYTVCFFPLLVFHTQGDLERLRNATIETFVHPSNKFSLDLMRSFGMVPYSESPEMVDFGGVKKPRLLVKGLLEDALMNAADQVRRPMNTLATWPTAVRGLIEGSALSMSGGAT